MDPWRVLGLSAGASHEDVRRAYLRLAKELHPDVNGSSAALEMMRLVNLAYEELTSSLPRPQASPTGPIPVHRCRCATCSLTMPIGKYQGAELSEIWLAEPGYVNWCVHNFETSKQLWWDLMTMLRHNRGAIWER